MSPIFLYKTQAQRMPKNNFSKMAEMMGMGKKIVETEEALAVHDGTRALVYGQPCATMAGVLFYTDNEKSLGEIPEKTLDTKIAKRWSDDFLKGFNLLPKKTEDERIDLKFETTVYYTEAVTFDGKKRERVKVNTEIASRISLNGIPVIGPRAKLRMAFKDKEKPVMIHRGLWERIDVYEERERIREHDVVSAVKESLCKRRCDKSFYDIRDIRLAYFAREFSGGPDVLAPHYFIEIEFPDDIAEKSRRTQGPRQILHLPAYR